MGLVAVAEAEKWMDRMQTELSDRDKEFVLQFAFRTEDAELVNKLIEELGVPGSNKEAVYRKYETMVDDRPDWIQKIENLLVALERYRIQEEKAVKTLSEILSAYGIQVTEEELKNTDVGEIKTRLKKEASL